MALRRTIRRLTFEIDIDGDVHTYVVPPVDNERGSKLAALMGKDTDQLARTKTTSEEMFRLALTDGLWEQMSSDGVPHVEMFTAGMAASAHFQTLLVNANPVERLDRAEEAARAVWEAGLDPERVAAFTAAQTPKTKRSTRTAAATTTPSPASGSSTKTKTTPTKARPSRGTGSRRSTR